ncbi:MAG TPA: hypothetical protein VFG67_07670, partial [Oleiagrimonas sp.]|nr:hypothetical protein [Oleiagrimonas sp.]
PWVFGDQGQQHQFQFAMGKYPAAAEATAAMAAAESAFAVAETAETSTVPAGAMHGFVHVVEKGAVVVVPE